MKLLINQEATNYFGKIYGINKFAVVTNVMDGNTKLGNIVLAKDKTVYFKDYYYAVEFTEKQRAKYKGSFMLVVNNIGKWGDYVEPYVRCKYTDSGLEFDNKVYNLKLIHIVKEAINYAKGVHKLAAENEKFL